MKKIIQKKEIILIILLLVLSGILYAGTRFFQSGPALRAEISVDGEVIEVLDLSKDTELTIEGYHSGTNHIIIKDGTVSVTEASCPDKICVHQGTIQRTGETIVCLPNRMIVLITGE